MSSSSSRFQEWFVRPFQAKPEPNSLKKRILLSIGIPVWVFLGFMLAQAIVIVSIELLQNAGVSLSEINASLLQVIAGGVVYALSLLVVIGVPWLVKKSRTTKEELGTQRLPSWKDIALVPPAAITYLVLTVAVTTFAMTFLTFINYDQAQDTGFSNMSNQFEYIMAFIMLVIIAPVAEELLFRGYLFGKLRKYTPIWGAMLITSIVFGIVHLAWNVGLDVFALSLVLCAVRVISGSIWPSMMLHMLKNSIAYFFLFVYPVLQSTIGG